MSNIKLDSPIQNLFGKLKNRQPLYQIIARKMAAAVEENFKTEGKRIGGWAKLKHSTIKQKRRRKGAKQILQHSGYLVRSIQREATNDHAAVGTNLRYGRIHQEGGIIHRSSKNTLRKKLKSSKAGGTNNRTAALRRKLGSSKSGFGTSRIPARPFLKLNDEDWAEIKNGISNYLLRK